MFAQFEQLKIQSKLLLIFGAIVFVGVVITAWTVVSITTLDKLANNLLAAERELGEVLKARNWMKEMEITELGYVLSHDEKFLHFHEEFFIMVDVFLRNAFIREEDKTAQVVLHEIENGFQDYHDYVTQVFQAAEEQEWEEATSLGEESALIVESMISRLEILAEEEQAHADEQVAASRQQVRTSSIVGGVVLVVFFILAFGAALVVNNQVVKPIVMLIGAAGAIENGSFEVGSLNKLAQRSDEIGRLAAAFNLLEKESSARSAALNDRLADLGTEDDSKNS